MAESTKKGSLISVNTFSENIARQRSSAHISNASVKETIDSRAKDDRYTFSASKETSFKEDKMIK
jgi:hypothetical protein